MLKGQPVVHCPCGQFMTLYLSLSHSHSYSPPQNFTATHLPKWQRKGTQTPWPSSSYNSFFPLKPQREPTRSLSSHQHMFQPPKRGSHGELTKLISLSLILLRSEIKQAKLFPPLTMHLHAFLFQSFTAQTPPSS